MKFIGKSVSFSALVCGTVAVLVSVSGCAFQSRGNDQSDRPGLVQDALALRDDTGLFRMPESERAVEGDVYTTALYASVDPDGKLVRGVDVAAVGQKVGNPSAASTPTFWSAVALKSFGPPAVEIGELPRIPDKQVTADADIAAVWYWADAVRNLGRGTSSEPDVSAARGRLATINVADVDQHPYLLWRLWDAYDALEATPPEELTTLLRSVAVTKLPQTPEAIFDTQAVFEVQRRLATSSPAIDGLNAHLRGLLSGEVVSEDITRTSILRTLNLLGDTDETRRYLDSRIFAKRIDSSNGLVRPVISHVGTIEGTYLVSRLLDQSFADAGNDTTANTLASSLERDEFDDITKVKALVSLKRLGDQRWNKHPDILRSVRKSLPSVVAVDQMEAYLDAIDALVQVEEAPQFSRLERFEVPASNGQLRYRALLALSKSAYFSNRSEIAGWFEEEQQALRGLVSKPSEPLVLYFAGLSAMASSPMSGLNSADFTRATDHLDKLRGCGGYKTLYRVAEDPRAPCSLRLSVDLMAAPGAFDFGGSS